MRYVRSYITEFARKTGAEASLTPLNGRFFLQEDVKPELLSKALNDMLKLYPIFGFTFEEDGDEVYLADSDTPVSIYETDKIILPDGKRLDGHLTFVGYSGNMISISVAHSLSDGVGVSTFFGKVFKRYKQLLNGEKVEDITGPAYDVALMAQQLPNAEVENYQEYVPFKSQGKAVHLPMLSGKEPYWNLICRVDEAAFMEYVRKNNTSAMVALAQITDKGIFKMYPDEGDFIKTMFAIDAKKALKMEKAFSSQADYGLIDISRDEIDDPECLKRVRADIKGQCTAENLLYRALKPDGVDFIGDSKAATYLCSYLRVSDDQGSLIEKHESVPLYFGALPKLDVRTYKGQMEFAVSGSSECKKLFAAVKSGLEQVGLVILNEDYQNIRIENGEMTVIDNVD